MILGPVHGKCFELDILMRQGWYGQGDHPLSKALYVNLNWGNDET